jgi:hypothetical protein
MPCSVLNNPSIQLRRELGSKYASTNEAKPRSLRSSLVIRFSQSGIELIEKKFPTSIYLAKGVEDKASAPESRSANASILLGSMKLMEQCVL